MDWIMKFIIRDRSLHLPELHGKRIFRKEKIKNKRAFQEEIGTGKNDKNL